MDKNFLYSVILVVTIGIHQCFSIKDHLEKHEPPKPYKFGYEVKDKEGAQYRHEEGDGHGSVRGSYGFVDDKGIHREVHYVADHNGFRAKVITNEPGTANQDPADVKMIANPPKHEIPEIPKVHIPKIHQVHIPKMPPVHHISKIPELHVPQIPEVHYFPKIQPVYHNVRKYKHDENSVQQDRFQLKHFHQQQPKKHHTVLEHDLPKFDIPEFDYEFPMHKYRDFQYIPQHNYGHDFWQPKFHQDGHFHRFGRYNPSSYIFGGMGDYHF